MTRNIQTRGQLTNQLHTLLLIMAMVLVLGILGYVLAGLPGLKLAMIAGILAALFTPSVPPAFVMARMGARPIHPDQAPGLFRLTAQIAQRAGLPRLPKLYLLPSGQLNAFAMGSPENGAVAVTQGLFKVLTTREMAGILSHEITHIKNNDTRVMALSALFGRLTQLLSLGGQLVLILSLPLILAGAFEINLWLILTLALAPWVSLFAFQALSRTREFEADLGSARLLDDPGALASALAKISAFTPYPWYRRIAPYPAKAPLLASHPPTAERIRRLVALAPPRPRFAPGLRGPVFLQRS